MANNYVYNNNNFQNESDYTQEELEQMAREVQQSAREHEERLRQNALRVRNAQLTNVSRRRLGRLLRQQPGVRGLVGRARGTVNARRRAAAVAQARANAINAKWREARAKYKRNVNNVAEAEFGTNAVINAEAEQNRLFLADLPEDEQVQGFADIEEAVRIRKASRQSKKNAAKQQILNGLLVSRRASNSNIYENTKRNMLSQPERIRQTILKISAIEDLLVQEKMNLAVAENDDLARQLATRIVDLETLKAELRNVIDTGGVPTAEQDARYAALIAGVDFSTINSSLYHRLAQNAAAKAREEAEAAAAAAAAAERARAEAEVAARARAEAEAEAAAYLAANPVAPMVPINVPAQPQGQALGGIARPLNKAALQAARLARLSGSSGAGAGKGGKRRRSTRRRGTQRRRGT